MHHRRVLPMGSCQGVGMGEQGWACRLLLSPKSRGRGAAPGCTSWYLVLGRDGTYPWLQPRHVITASSRPHLHGSSAEPCTTWASVEAGGSPRDPPTAEEGGCRVSHLGTGPCCFSCLSSREPS